MRLSKFIEEHHEEIIGEWVDFAATLLPWAKGMSDTDLRDHAEQLLTAVVADMKEPQTADEQADKAQGLSPGGALAKIGQAHASERLATGFNLDQLVSEYRALRASILRLWAQAQGEEANDVTRFNEAIDESLTEATVRYSQIVDHTREQFLGILGHDLRNPLNSIVMGATVLTRTDSLGDKEVRIATRVLSSAKRMGRMVNDLLDLTRTRLGSGIPVTPTPIDLTHLCEQVISELGTVHPDCDLRFEAKGDLKGAWDADRLTQVVSNLVANALQHGGEHGAVRLVADGEGEGVVLSVHNGGRTIAPKVMTQIFEPMIRSAPEGVDRNATGLGLGLYIAREVVTAHGGTIRVTSTAADGTCFVVELPRYPTVRESVPPRDPSQRRSVPPPSVAP